MTIIAWDGTTLAADRKLNTGSVPVRVRKVHRMRHDGQPYLVGFAGDWSGCVAYHHWMKTGERLCEVTWGEFEVLCIAPDGRVYMNDQDGIWVRVKRPFVAIGCAEDIAHGAMAHGATAVEAVRIAIGLNSNCGFGIDVVRF